MLEQRINILPVDKLAEIVGGRYRLVTLINRRLRQIMDGSPVLVEQKPNERLIETVAREIEAKKIWLEMPDDTVPVASNAHQDISELFDMDS